MFLFSFLMNGASMRWCIPQPLSASVSSSFPCYHSDVDHIGVVWCNANVSTINTMTDMVTRAASVYLKLVVAKMVECEINPD